MTFLDKLKERTSQVHAALEDAITGERVSNEVREERMNICLSCEHLFRPTMNCKKCGCFTKVKTWLPSQHCPVGKWLAVELKE